MVTKARFILGQGKKNKMFNTELSSELIEKNSRRRIEREREVLKLVIH